MCVSVSIFMNCDRHRDLSEIIAHDKYKKKNSRYAKSLSAINRICKEMSDVVTC